MTSAELQQCIDGYSFSIPRGRHDLDVPVFIDRSNLTISGHEDGDTVLNCGSGAGTAFVVGWRRGMVGDEHYTPQGFRTYGTTCLFARGTEFDLGPMGLGASSGWRGQSQFTLYFSATIHDGDWGDDWAYLCGIQSQLAGPWDTEPDQPSPFVLYWDPSGSPRLILSIRTSDGVRRRFLIPADETVLALDLVIVIDLTTATISATVSGQLVTVGIETQDWPQGLAFADNYHFPFCAGTVSPINALGWWGGLSRDMTVRRCELRWGERAALVQFDVPRPATYPGGPSLPLIRAWSSYGGQSIRVMHKDQGVADLVGRTRIQDVYIRESWSNPSIDLGSIQGDLWIERCHFEGHTRAVQTSGLAVTYPIWLNDCWFGQSLDRNLWLRTVATMSLNRCTFAYFTRAAATIWNCNTTIRDGFVAPRADGTTQDYVFEIWGGSAGFENVVSDYEFEPAPTSFTVIPYQPWWDYSEPSEVDLVRSGGGVGERWAVEPTRGVGDIGTATLRVNGTQVLPVVV